MIKWMIGETVSKTGPFPVHSVLLQQTDDIGKGVGVMDMFWEDLK